MNACEIEKKDYRMDNGKLIKYHIALCGRDIDGCSHAVIEGCHGCIHETEEGSCTCLEAITEVMNIELRIEENKRRASQAKWANYDLLDDVNKTLAAIGGARA